MAYGVSNGDVTCGRWRDPKSAVRKYGRLS